METNIDYKALYEEARERAKQVKLTDTKENVAAAEYIFPDLKESEDERMVEMAIKAVRSPQAQSCIRSWGVDPDDVITWLEKQKEEEGMITVSKESWDENAKDSFERGIKVGMIRQQKEQKPIEFKNDELVETIKGEFEGFRTLLKKKGIDYEPHRSYWEAFARLFDSSAKEYVKEGSMSKSRNP